MSNEVGISPALLQAISQSLTSTSNTDNNTSAVKMESTNSVTGNGSGEDLVTQLIQQNKAVSDSGTTSDTIKAMLKIKMAANALTKSVLNEDGSVKSVSSDTLTTSEGGTVSDLAMASMLTALASQSSRVVPAASAVQSSGQTVSAVQSPATNASGVTTMTIGGQRVIIRTKPTSTHVAETGVSIDTLVSKLKNEPFNGNGGVLQDNESVQALPVPTSSPISVEGSVKAVVPDVTTVVPDVTPVAITAAQSNPTASSSDNGGRPIVICYSSDSGSPGIQNVVLAPNGEQLLEYGGKKYIIHSSVVAVNEETVAPADGEQAEKTFIQVADDSCTNVATQEVVTEGGAATMLSPSMSNPCPICGDNISGFHYGIFTCESCKGFFKRTVQNKKSFLCHRQGECEITLENRKKCPACRFAKCLVMGMKLEAIRIDRTRGGRSSYTGLSTLDQSKRKRPIKQLVRRPRIPSPTDSRLVTALNYGEDSEASKAYVPQILTDIMNLESLLCDDDIPPGISGDDFPMSDPSVYLTLLQLCELKLYKIVRWARNLPYFANISTDDQILLLQNCWCELLALTMCWKSLQLSNEIMFFHGQAIDRAKADQLDVGEMFKNLLAVVDHFRRLKLDQYECVALKVIILICPDIKGLNDCEKLAEQQAKVSAALESYISSHYQNSPSKFGEVILRLSELSRISGMLKDHLMSWMPPNTTSCGLLYELLKGENMKDLV